MLSPLGERVAFHDGDPLVGVGQHPGGEQPGQAGPQITAWSPILRILHLRCLARCFDARSEGIGRFGRTGQREEGRALPSARLQEVLVGVGGGRGARGHVHGEDVAHVTVDPVFSDRTSSLAMA